MNKVIFALAFAVVAVPAVAMNMNVFQDAPITRLNADEVKAFRAAVMKILDEGADGTMVEWKAPKTEFTSKITPQKRFTDGKYECREAVVESEAHDRFQRGRYTFCKGQKGDWVFRNPTSKRKK
jgi:surface antigen